MLIPSERHRPEDLELWWDFESADLTAYLTHHVEHRCVGPAERAIETFLDRGPAFCAVSWGKDSTVLADIVTRVRPKTPLVWIRVEPIVNPDCVLVRDSFLDRYPAADYHEIEVWCRRSRDGWHATGTLEEGAARARRGFGARHVSGVRAAESGTRKLSRAVHGVATETTCRPLIDWKTADVFAYLAHHGLPTHPAYAMLGGGRYDRERIRVASLGGRRGDGIGRAEWEKSYYGDVLRRMEALRRC